MRSGFEQRDTDRGHDRRCDGVGCQGRAHRIQRGSKACDIAPGPSKNKRGQLPDVLSLTRPGSAGASSSGASLAPPAPFPVPWPAPSALLAWPFALPAGPLAVPAPFLAAARAFAAAETALPWALAMADTALPW